MLDISLVLEHKALAIQHICHVRMSGDENNNRTERFNGEIRDREKVMRSLKKDDSSIPRILYRGPRYIEFGENMDSYVDLRRTPTPDPNTSHLCEPVSPSRCS